MTPVIYSLVTSVTTLELLPRLPWTQQPEAGKASPRIAALPDEAAILHMLREPLQICNRLSRLKIDNVLAYLDDEDLELRRAAALACALKEARETAGRLIELLEDPELPVQRAAYAALKSLSGKDFGPAAKVSGDDKAKAIAAWRAWWKQHPGK